MSPIRHPRLIMAAVALLAGLTFAADLALPLGLAAGVLYVAAVLVSLWFSSARATVAVAVVCTLLTLIGFVYSPLGGEQWIAVVNRIFAAFAIWATAGITLLHTRTAQRNAEHEDRYRDLIDESLQGVLIHRDRKPVYANPALAAMLGYADAGEVVALESSEQIYAPHERARVLVVEDNAVNQKVALGMLAKLGYRAEVAGDGEQALLALRRRTYALVLMDCQLPVLDGYAATERLRAAENAGEHLPVIAMTANALEGDAERCLAAGMDDYLAKPVSLDALEAKLQAWLPWAADTPDPPERRATEEAISL